MKKPEILAPAGTLQSVIAALNGGCDAIYIGGKSFNARAYADNPSDDELKNIIFLCRLRGVKVFITINTLYKESEINSVLEFVSKIYSYGAYGVIVQDIGIASIIKKLFPELKISASTQMTIHNVDGVKLMNEIGYDRVVLARELSENEIADICCKKENTEIEGFIHGALCVCYSGRCLMSSFIGGRSGNRGRCAQPCRMEYSLIKNNCTIKKGYLLSPKDISTIDVIDNVINTGVDSLKIEGRMKSPEYVYQVVSTYRKYIDRNFDKVESQDLKNIIQIFNRGGSSSHGYFDSWSGKKMMSILTPKSSGIKIGNVTSYNPKTQKCSIKLSDNVVPGDGIEIWSSPHTGTGINKAADKGDVIIIKVKGKIKVGDEVYKSFDKALNDRLKKTYDKLIRKQKINTEIYVKKGLPIKISFTDYNIEITGIVAEKAQHQPMSAESIIQRIKKTGDTPFEIEIIKADIDDNIYVPVSALNCLRRESCTALENKILTDERKIFDFRYNTNTFEKSDTGRITVMVRTKEQFNAAMDSPANIIYCNILNPELAAIAKSKGKKFYYALPHISRDGYDKYIKTLDNTVCDGYVVRSYGRINTQKEIISDYTLNIMNRLSVEKLRELGFEKITLSPELNLKELIETADINSEIIVYGRLPLMTTHQCPVGLYDGNKGKNKYCKYRNSQDSYYLKDRKNIKFPLLRDCEGCIAYILNSAPIHTLDKWKDITSTGAGFMRLELTCEDYNTTLNIINSYINGTALEIRSSTKGHYYRGVQ